MLILDRLMVYRILIVEDDFRNALMLEAMLETERYIILRAQNGREAIQQTLEHIPDIILLDINLPDMSGIEVAKILRKYRETLHIPIIAISGHDENDNHGDFAADYDMFLPKPVNIQQLYDAILFYLNS